MEKLLEAILKEIKETNKLMKAMVDINRSLINLAMTDDPQYIEEIKKDGFSPQQD